jgi:hypothetical protein
MSRSARLWKGRVRPGARHGAQEPSPPCGRAVRASGARKLPQPRSPAKQPPAGGPARGHAPGWGARRRPSRRRRAPPASSPPRTAQSPTPVPAGPACLVRATSLPDWGCWRPVLAPAHDLTRRCTQRDGHELIKRGVRPSCTLAPDKAHKAGSPVTGEVASSHKSAHEHRAKSTDRQVPARAMRSVACARLYGGVVGGGGKLQVGAGERRRAHRVRMRTDGLRACRRGHAW